MKENDPIFRQNQSDRNYGYVILVVIFTIGLFAAGIGLYHLKTPNKSALISFEKIGNLKIDDPVFLLGIRVGRIKSIELREQNVLVRVNLEKPLRLHQGYHIDNLDVGIMGDRMISMTYGDTARPFVPEKDTLTGQFHPGVSESVGMAWKLQSVIDSFIKISAKLLHCTPQRPSFVQQVRHFASVTDTFTLSLATIITRLSCGLSAQLDTLDLLINGVARFSAQADSLARQHVTGLDREIGTIGKMLDKLESTIDGLMVAAAKLEGLDSLDKHGTMAGLMAKIKELRGTILHAKEGLFKLAKLGIQSL
jgi:ABC-type transporter Mla subunit MlaD